MVEGVHKVDEEEISEAMEVGEMVTQEETKNKQNESEKGRIKFHRGFKLVSRASSSGYDRPRLKISDRFEFKGEPVLSGCHEFSFSSR
uniref:Uncharacterized protein n=1 Tax=Solanum tuberosum TaxID=4113 RepID=M1DYH9_SOLTU